MRNSLAAAKGLGTVSVMLRIVRSVLVEGLQPECETASEEIEPECKTALSIERIESLLGCETASGEDEPECETALCTKKIDPVTGVWSPALTPPWTP